MGAKKLKLVTDFGNSIDFINFKSANNELPILDIVHERFLRNFRVSLSNGLHSLCRVFLTTERLTFEEWLKREKNQSVMYIVGLESVNSSAYFRFDNDFSNGIIDMLSGGKGKVTEQGPSREFTQIDINLIRIFADLAISDFELAWKPVHVMNARYIRTEVNPKFAICDQPTAKYYSTKIRVELENFSGTFEILYPFRTLFPLRDKLFS